MSAFILALPVGLLCLLVIWFAWQLRREQKLTEQWRALAKDWEAAHAQLLASLEPMARPGRVQPTAGVSGSMARPEQGKEQR